MSTKCALPVVAANPPFFSVMVQPPRMATPAERATNEARNGATRVPGTRGLTLHAVPLGLERRPKLLAPGLKRVGCIYKEWTEGVGGRFPVRLMTSNERNTKENRDRWKQRKNIMEMMSKLVNLNILPARAIQMIEEAYPRTSVTAMNTQLGRDMRSGTLPPILSF